MGFIEIFKEYDTMFKDCFLKEVTDNVEDFVLTEIVEGLKSAYQEKNPNPVRMATLYNSIFTHHAQTFMLTRRVFGELIKKDPNSPYSYINSLDYKTSLSIMMKSGHFKCLRSPKGRKSGVYKLVQPEAVQNLYKLHSIEWFQEQESRVLDYYDSEEEKVKVPLSEMLKNKELLKKVKEMPDD